MTTWNDNPDGPEYPAAPGQPSRADRFGRRGRGRVGRVSRADRADRADRAVGERRYPSPASPRRERTDIYATVFALGLALFLLLGYALRPVIGADGVPGKVARVAGDASVDNGRAVAFASSFGFRPTDDRRPMRSAYEGAEPQEEIALVLALGQDRG